jgi:hypothetical protein
MRIAIISEIHDKSFEAIADLGKTSPDLALPGKFGLLLT